MWSRSPHQPSRSAGQWVIERWLPGPGWIGDWWAVYRAQQRCEMWGRGPSVTGCWPCFLVVFMHWPHLHPLLAVCYGQGLRTPSSSPVPPHRTFSNNMSALEWYGALWPNEGWELEKTVFFSGDPELLWFCLSGNQNQLWNLLAQSPALWVFYFKKNFGHAAQYVGILILKPGINLCPLHLKLGVLTTGPPEKSQESKSLAILVQRLWRTGNWPLFLST